MKVLFLSFLLISWAFAWDSCVYSSKKDEGALTPFTKCIKIDKNNNVLINEKHLKNIKFLNNDLTCIYYTGSRKNSARVFYKHKNGKIKESFYFDNGCDYFNQELSRTYVNKKIAYMNKNLEVLINTSFFYGSRFYKNKAIVCDKNLIRKIKFEQLIYEGGSCNVIDLKGNLLLKKELKYEKVLNLLNEGKI